MVKRHGKRSHKKSHKRSHRRHRKTMRGGFLGAAGALAPGAMEWRRGSEYGPMVADRAGNTTAWGPAKPGGLPMYGRGRSRTRKMKGGGSYGATRAEFRGDGNRGFANHSQGQAKTAPGPNDFRLGSFNDGNKGFSGFKGLFPK